MTEVFLFLRSHAAGYSGELQAAVGNLAEAHEPHRLPATCPKLIPRQADVAMGVMSGPLSPVNPKTGKTVSIMAVDCMLAGRGPVLSDQVVSTSCGPFQPCCSLWSKMNGIHLLPCCQEMVCHRSSVSAEKWWPRAFNVCFGKGKALALNHQLNKILLSQIKIHLFYPQGKNETCFFTIENGWYSIQLSFWWFFSPRSLGPQFFFSNLRGEAKERCSKVFFWNIFDFWW